jgi:mRNA interferase RelE/StbE
MEFFFKPRTEKQLLRFDHQIKIRILKKLKFYSSQENPLLFAERTIDRKFGDWKFKIGDYRVLFDFEVRSKKIIILKIGRCKNVYK